MTKVFKLNTPFSDIVKEAILEAHKKNPEAKDKELINEAFNIAYDYKVEQLCKYPKEVYLLDGKVIPKSKLKSCKELGLEDKITVETRKTEEIDFLYLVQQMPGIDTITNFTKFCDFSVIPHKNPFFHKEDNDKFVMAFYKLFPNINAYSFGKALTTFRKFIENIYYNLGFPGLQPQQTCLYQYSAMGGTGKSLFNERLRHFLDTYNISYCTSAPYGRWVGSEYSRCIVAFQDEWLPPKGYDKEETIKKINSVIDNTYYEVEYKGKDKAQLKSITSLVLNSNYRPFDVNDRRYGIVEYNEVPYSELTDEQKQKYFPERTPEEWDSIFLDAFESCPFGKVYKDYESPKSESFNELIYLARKIVKNDIDDCSQLTLREALNMYYHMTNAYDTNEDTQAKKQKLFQIRSAVRKAVSKRLLVPAVKVNGNTDYSKYNFYEISEMLTSEDDNDNPLNEIEDYYECTEVALKAFINNNKPAESRVISTKLSDDNLFVNKFTTSTGEVGFTKCETTNNMQEYVVVNKPLPHNDGTSRKNDDVEQNCFLLEIDGNKDLDYPNFDFIHKDDGITWKGSEEEKTSAMNAIQEYMKPFSKTFRKNLKWICKSGRLSVHAVLKTNIPVDRVDAGLREYIFNKINTKYFNNRLDNHCKNAGRLGRNPNAFRDNGRQQTALFINENCEALDVSQWIEEYDNMKARQEQQRKEMEQKLISTPCYNNWDNSLEGLTHQLEAIINVSNNESGKLALVLARHEPVPSGANLIGAIGYMKKLYESDPKWFQLLLEVGEEAHRQHPSNIGKSVVLDILSK